jgi:hypothetical protein
MGVYLTELMQLFDRLRFWAFVSLACAGFVAGFGLCVSLHAAGLPRDGQAQSRKQRFTDWVGRLSQSAAIGLALTLPADLLAVSRASDVRLLARLPVLVAAATSFGAASLRELIRRLFYKDS